jgi:hypothetical protein
VSYSLDVNDMRFRDYVQGHNQVPIATRREIARHWLATHPFRA